MKLCILDKDGTLTTPLSGNQYVQSPYDQMLIRGVVEKLEILKNQDYKFYIASNQYGVGKGFKTLKSAIEEIKFCVAMLDAAGIKIEQSAICPDWLGRKCILINYDIAFEFPLINEEKLENLKLIGKFRKPHPGMLKVFDNLHSWEDKLMIGNQNSDRKAAESALFRYMDVKELLKLNAV
jgi:HAD superfamily hydrolase (TIGR01662 family)